MLKLFTRTTRCPIATTRIRCNLPREKWFGTNFLGLERAPYYICCKNMPLYFRKVREHRDEIYVESSATPKLRARSIPHTFMKKVKEKHMHLLEEGMLEPAETADRAVPIVPAEG